jgi:predicted Zn finger-like uncharacterized protein
MDVTCPACTARYTADEQKLRGKTARMRCRACDTVWLVSGPEDDMNEAKRAAVVKRGGERDHRDMFASRPADLGSVKQTLRPPPAEHGGVAARNESSVLFTVDALMGAARMKTPAPAPAPAPLSSAFMPSDDEGIIDLNALASCAPKVGARSVAPLFSEPPPGAFAADVGHTGPNDVFATPGGFKLGKRAIAGIAAAALAVVLCSVGLAAAFKGEEPVVRATAAMAPITPVTAAVTAPTPPPEPVITAATTTDSSSSDAASDDDDTKTPAKGKKRKGRKGKGRAFAGTKVQSSGVASKSSKSSSGAPKATPKAADKCHCKGDFNCILRCTAKGR